MDTFVEVGQKGGHDPPEMEETTECLLFELILGGHPRRIISSICIAVFTSASTHRDKCGPRV